MRYLLLIISFIFLTSCANTVESSKIKFLEGDYLVTGISGINVISEEIIFNFNTVGNRISGNTGCNQFSAHFHQEGNEVEFSTPMNTRRFCEGKMETERQLLSFIEKTVRFDFSGEEVIFYSDDGQQLITITKRNQSE